MARTRKRSTEPNNPAPGQRRDYTGIGRATIEHVAERAGVSVATVSRALRGLPNVAASTRARVEAAALELSYRPDPNASRLAAGRTYTIGMAVPLIGRWYFSQVVAGAHKTLTAAGYDLLLMGVDSVEARHRFITEWAVLHKRVDGLVMVDLRLSRPEVAELKAASAVVSTVGDRYPPFSSVTIDNRAGAGLAVRHLLDLGHRRIGLIGTGPRVSLSFWVPDERRKGYRDALGHADVTNDPVYEAPGDFTVEGGASGMRRLLALRHPPTAVFAMSDEIAMGAMQVARQSGLRVPEDISFVGFDDHEMAAVVGLTTIRQPVARCGELAARFVIDAIEDASGPQHAVEPFELVVRTSTAAVSRRR